MTETTAFPEATAAPSIPPPAPAEMPTHSTAFRVRRALNWFPLGLAYAFLYMGRYNLNVSKTAMGDVLSKAEFGEIFGVGAIVYGWAFVINGPLTDRIGGRRSMLIGVMGALIANVLMGLALYAKVYWGWSATVFWTFMLLYAVNMYFQSFGAVAIVTVKAPWFHVRERGTFSTIFGIMIALGIYFAFDWGQAIADATRAKLPEKLGVVSSVVRAVFGVGGGSVDQNWWLFFIPALLLLFFWVVMLIWLRDTPSHAGYKDFDTGEASISDDGERLPVKQIFITLLKHPVLRIICLIEFASGVLRNGVTQWYPLFAAETGISKTFVITQNWGLSMLIAGVLGAFLTGWASDRFFASRRAPMAGILYVMMLIATVAMTLSLDANPWVLGLSAMVVSMAVIGVHGIMSGTSTVDFGGTKNGGAAVGIVDGLVYLGTALQSLAAGRMTPKGGEAKIPGNWTGWTGFLIPFAVMGLLLSLRIWKELPKGRKA